MSPYGFTELFLIQVDSEVKIDTQYNYVKFKNKIKLKTK